jgi:RND superfamily putative drug exporter
MYTRLGTWCHDRRWVVLVIWIVVLIGGNGIASGIGEDYRQDFTLPGAESTEGFDLLTESFGGFGTGQSGTIVFRAEQGVGDTEVQAAMTALFAEVAELDGVVRVESPYGEEGTRFISSQGPAAGTIAYANVEMPEDIEFALAEEIRDEITASVPDIDGLQVELGGYIFAEFEEPNAEALGLGFAVVILIVAFGSVLAMGLPIGVAVFGVGLGGAAVILVSRIMSVPEFAPFIGIMIGLGVGIDYALLIVTRHREQIHVGHTVRESVGIAMDTAGRSVLFAGLTVVISVLGMLLMGISFVQGLAVTAALTVLFTVAASLTLLPALLGFAGGNIERTRWRGLVAAGFVALGLAGVGLDVTPLTFGFPIALLVLVVGSFIPALKREVAHRPPKPRRETVAYRWSRIIQHRPWPAALAGVAVLLVLAAPVLSLRLAFSDESNFAEDTTTRQAYELLVEGFGEGFNGPLALVTRLPEGTGLDALAAVNEALASDPSVAFVAGPIPNSPEAPTAAIWNVFPIEGPQEASTEQLVHRLRDSVLPPVEEATGTELR